jgi:hypothetical protein
MRGLAYGILDPDGERYRLALVHVKSRENDNGCLSATTVVALVMMRSDGCFSSSAVARGQARDTLA